jgi:hypothetical protein
MDNECALNGNWKNIHIGPPLLNLGFNLFARHICTIQRQSLDIARDFGSGDFILISLSGRLVAMFLSLAPFE